jgi:GAF domain-containing protein
MGQEGIGAAAEHPGNRILYIPDSTALSPPELAASFDSQSPRSAVIQQIADIITTAQDLSQASLPFLNAIQKLVDCQIASIYAISEATNVVTELLFASTLPIQRKTGDTWPFSGNALELHLKLGYPHIQDLELDHPYPGSHKYLEAGIKRTLWAPLTHQGQTIGLIVLHSTKPDAFDYNHLASISRLATLIAPSVEETIKLWEARQELQSTQALNQSRESLSDVVDYRQALELICQKCCELLASHYAILAEVEGDELVYRWAWLSWASGPFQPDEKEARCSLKQSNPGLAARVALSGQPEVINYVAETPRKDLDLELLGFPDVTSIMAVPMVESGWIIGVLLIRALYR